MRRPANPPVDLDLLPSLYLPPPALGQVRDSLLVQPKRDGAKSRSSCESSTTLAPPPRTRRVRPAAPPFHLSSVPEVPDATLNVAYPKLMGNEQGTVKFADSSKGRCLEGQAPSLTPPRARQMRPASAPVEPEVFNLPTLVEAASELGAAQLTEYFCAPGNRPRAFAVHDLDALRSLPHGSDRGKTSARVIHHDSAGGLSLTKTLETRLQHDRVEDVMPTARCSQRACSAAHDELDAATTTSNLEIGTARSVRPSVGDGQRRDMPNVSKIDFACCGCMLVIVVSAASSTLTMDVFFSVGSAVVQFLVEFVASIGIASVGFLCGARCLQRCYTARSVKSCETIAEAAPPLASATAGLSSGYQ